MRRSSAAMSCPVFEYKGWFCSSVRQTSQGALTITYCQTLVSPKNDTHLQIVLHRCTEMSHKMPKRDRVLFLRLVSDSYLPLPWFIVQLRRCENAVSFGRVLNALHRNRVLTHRRTWVVAFPPSSATSYHPRI